MTANLPVCEIASDRHFILGGKVLLHQNADGGHRAGLDAVLLAASIKPPAGSHIIDLGAGVGSAGLCVLARHQGVSATLVENDLDTLAYTKLTLADPDNDQFRDRVTLLDADVSLRGEAREKAGLGKNMADTVIMNPPYWEAGTVRRSPHDTKGSAHILTSEGLTPWMRTAAAILRACGLVSIIFPADGLSTLLSEMDGRFGGVKILPIYKGAGENAIRVIVQGIKGSRAPLKILPGLVLHKAPEPGQSRRPYTKQANDILNGDAGLVI